MKVSPNTALFIAKLSKAVFSGAVGLVLVFSASSARADETC
jgi:hypothetical protein